jgi:hypothetical protein
MVVIGCQEVGDSFKLGELRELKIEQNIFIDIASWP